MDRPRFKRMLFQALAWAGLVALCGVFALAQDAPAAQASGARSDGQIEMDVVHALDASQALKNDLITAATIQSEVTLSGTVSSESNRELAESIAAQCAGRNQGQQQPHCGRSSGRRQRRRSADGRQRVRRLPMAPIPPPPPAEGQQQASEQTPYPSQSQTTARPASVRTGASSGHPRPPAYEMPKAR